MPGKRIFWALSIGLICVLAMAALVLATENDSRLADAAGQGDRAAVRSLLKQGADVNAAFPGWNACAYTAFSRWKSR